MIILDGGMGHQLKAMGAVTIEGEVGSLRRFLGVAMANIEAPHLVREAHRAYLDAGAEVITTNSYSCVPKVLKQLGDDRAQLAALLKSNGEDEDTLVRLIQAAGSVARDARDEFWEEQLGKAGCSKKPLVAGCLPPLAESYRADKVGPFQENYEHYRVIARAIAPFSNLLLCETMSTALEGRAAVQAACDATDLPIWLAWTLDEATACEDGAPRLRSGETLEQAYLMVREFRPRLQGLLFNCTSPEACSAAVPRLKEIVEALDKDISAGSGSTTTLPQIRVGAYANGFRTAASGSGEYREDLCPAEYAANCLRWAEDGASVVGGCCAVFPRHIRGVAEAMREAAVAKDSCEDVQ